MGWLDRILGREQFSSFVPSDPAFAAWWFGTDDSSIETVTPYTVMGLSAVLRSVQIISTTIAGLPLRTYERQGEDRIRVPSVFDDPYPGIDGMTPFAWVETVLIHLLLWRECFLWHDAFNADGSVSIYKPIIPDAFKVTRSGGRRQFEYTDPDTHELKTVGSERITYIPGPSIDGVRGHALLWAARSVFSAAISGDKTAQLVLRRGIRIAGLVTPADDQEDFDETEGSAILEQLRGKVVGREHAGDAVLINKRLKLQSWTPNNIEAQWHETRGDVLGEIGRLFGIPPHLLNDIDKQTSWGTGVSEQNLGLSRYTLRGWSDRIEQVLRLRLPGPRSGGGSQFVEFDYKGLLQGTPAEEIRLLIEQKAAGLITTDEARKVMNLPPLTDAQRVDIAPPQPQQIAASVTPQEPDRFADLSRYVDLQSNGRTDAILATLAAREPSITVNTPDVHLAPTTVSIAPGAVQVDIAPPAVTVETAPVHIEAPVVTVDADGTPRLVETAPKRTVIDYDPEGEIVGSHEELIVD